MEQHIESLNNLPERITQLAVESIVIPAASKMTASIIRRNVNEGKNTDGTKRNGYSTKPKYATQQQFVVKGAFKPQGKGGNKTKKNGQPNKSMYLPGGYNQQREIQGRRTDVKNYEYSGDLINDFGFEGQPEQNRAVIGFRSELQSVKRKALEKKNGLAFPPSPDEITDYKTEVKEESEKLTIKLMTTVS